MPSDGEFYIYVGIDRNDHGDFDSCFSDKFGRDHDRWIRFTCDLQFERLDLPKHRQAHSEMIV